MPPATTTPQPVLTAHGISKRYGSRVAVETLDLELAEGELYGLLGPNGAGKTTSIHMLSTLVRPDRGTIRVAGYDVLSQPVQVRAQIGLVFQDSALDRTLSAWENLLFCGQLYNMESAHIKQNIRSCLQLFKLWERRHEPVANLSGGMRRALDIARGVLHRPRVLFLDEPTTGLDVLNRRAIWNFLEQLRQTGLTLLLSTHYLEEARNCNRVAFMREGRIIGSGEPGALIHALGDHVLEIDTPTPAEHARRLGSTLGTPIRLDNRLLFAVRSDQADLGALQRNLREEVHSLQLRRPDLNDVYTWINCS